MFAFARPHRRHRPRHVFRTRCQAVREPSFSLVGERILDLSTQGALLACDAEVREGETILLSFRAPWLGPWLDVSARVSRVIEGWREGDPGYCAGVRFIGLDPASRAELERRLDPLPEIPARRRLPIDYAETVRRIAFGARRASVSAR